MSNTKKINTCMCLCVGNSRVTVGSDVFMSTEVCQRSRPLLDEVMEGEAVGYHIILLDVDEIID